MENVRKMKKDVPKVHPNPYHHFLICKQLGFLLCPLNYLKNKHEHHE